MRSNDRPTRRFLARYFHDGAWWNADVYAYDFEDAQARCNLMNLKLDGEHILTIPCDPVAAPVVGPLVRLACRLRNTIARSASQG